MNMNAKRPEPRQLHRLLRDGLKLKQHVRFNTYPPRKARGGTMSRPSLLDHIWTAQPRLRCTRVAALAPAATPAGDHHAIRCHIPSVATSAVAPRRRVWRHQWHKLDSIAAAKLVAEEMAKVIPAFTGAEDGDGGKDSNTAGHPPILRSSPPPTARLRRADYARTSPGHPVHSQPAAVATPTAAEPPRVATARAVISKWGMAWERVRKELVPRAQQWERPTQPSEPWLDDVTRTARSHRTRLLRLAQQHPGDEQQWKAARAASTDAARAAANARRRWVKQRWEKCGPHGVNKDHWRFLNNITGRRARVRVEPPCSPDALNDAMLLKIEKIRASLQDAPRPEMQQLDGDTRFKTFARVGEDDVRAALRHVKPKRSAGLDGVPMATLLAAQVELAPHIACLANAVLVAGWPAEWKDAEVTALWKKKGSPQDPATFRPVALLPSISRVVERVLLPQLTSHMEQHSIMPPQQHGCRSRHSGETALAHLVHHVASARDRGKTVLVAALDATAAYDCLDHDILVEKMQTTAGIEGAALHFIRSWLVGRRQRTKMSGDRRSAWRPLRSGVPQGSVWSPWAYGAFTADLPSHITAAEVVAYCDDITLVVASDTPADAKVQMNRALKQFSEYAHRNRIAPSPEKTQLLASIPAVRAPRTTFAKLKEKLPGAWMASSAQLEVPNVTVTSDLVAHYDDGTTFQIASGPNGECQIDDFVVSRNQGRFVHWRNGEALVKWTRRAHQPAQEADKDPSKDSDANEAGDTDDTTALVCTMNGKKIKATPTITVLGAVIDDELSWAPQATAAARRADAATHQVARAASQLQVSVRAQLLRSLALPHLDLYQSALAAPSPEATNILRQAYNRAARVAKWGGGALHFTARGIVGDGTFDPTKLRRSADARRTIGWIEWEQRRAAAAARFAARVQQHQQPQLLAAMLHDSPTGLTEPGLDRGQGNADFAYWAPRMLNAVDTSTAAIFEINNVTPPYQREPPVPVSRGTAPSDEYALQKAAWYAELKAEFGDEKEFRSPDGAIQVWTDGGMSATQDGTRVAGAGIFYATGHGKNAAIPVDGPQTAARAELAAAVHVLRTEQQALDMCCDCRYVVDGLNHGRHRWRGDAWFRRALDAVPIPHANLWREADALLRRRRQPVTIRWTRGHPRRQHVVIGESTPLDAFGNVSADEQATRAVTEAMRVLGHSAQRR